MMLKTAAGTSDFTNRWMFVMILCRACGVGLDVVGVRWDNIHYE
jgi:hypothetical protein